jgi:hypothetical protein
MRLDPVPDPFLAERMRIGVSVTTNTATRGPLIYTYEVSGGKIIGDGPTVIWDFSGGVAPGDYKLSVTITDPLDPVGKTVKKTATVAEMMCHCACSCPSIEVLSNYSSARPGQTVEFEAFGSSSYRDVTYNWTISNGQIFSGQGTDHINVAVDSTPKATIVTAEVTLSGLDPACNCPNTASASIPIGQESVALDNASNLRGIYVDEKELVRPRRDPNPAGCKTKVSPDMIAGVYLSATKFWGTSDYRYTVTGGKIIGSGERVQWDLSDSPPGTYDISAKEFRGGKLIGEEQKAQIAVTTEPICDIFCPRISITTADQIVRPGQSFSVTTSLDRINGEMPTLYNWTVSLGQIVSGQGSRAITVMAPRTSLAGDLNVTLNVGGMEPSFACPNTAALNIKVEPDK